jgi:hypothetical protein
MVIKIAWGRSIGWNIDNNIVLGKDGSYYLRWGDKRKKLDYTIVTDGADCYPWRETFVIFPKKTITGKKVAWQKLYKRKVWVVWGTGFHMEPEVQYATLFEILNRGYDKD